MGSLAEFTLLAGRLTAGGSAAAAAVASELQLSTNSGSIRRVQRWCRLHHWTDLFLHDRQFYAFPPQAVIPLPLPAAAVNLSRSTEIGKTLQQGWFSLVAVVILVSLVTVCLELLLALGLLMIHILP